MTGCTLCPRRCKVNRDLGEVGYCGMDSGITVARAALHFWEEPCISGRRGSGAVFFSGCNLKCVYCQNHPIAIGQSGIRITAERLEEIFFELREKGAHNINLVTPTHFVPQIREAIVSAKEKGFSLPFVYNCGGYESPETIESLGSLIDIYIPDFKYWSSETATAFSSAPDYPEAAKAAIAQMHRRCPVVRFDSDGILQKGVIVRHMLLPEHVYEAKQIMKYLYTTYGDSIIYSIMSQYTPMQNFDKYPALSRRVKKKEYEKLVDYCIELGIENAYIQDGKSAEKSFIPPFDNEGVQQTERKDTNERISRRRI